MHIAPAYAMSADICCYATEALPAQDITDTINQTLTIGANAPFCEHASEPEKAPCSPCQYGLTLRCAKPHATGLASNLK